MTFLVIFLALGLLLVIGAPIFIALLLTSFLGVIFFTDVNPIILLQRSFSGIDKFVLMAIPFFILGANVMDVGGLSKRIIAVARALLGHINGGIGITTQAATTMFGALSGSGPATVVAIGRIIYPELVRGGYNKGWASALIIQSGSVALLIPPSISLLIFATVTNTSVASVFAAGAGAGVVFSLLAVIYIYLYARKHDIKGDEKASMPTVMKAMKDSILSILVPVIILGGIFTGLFTATEAAAVGSLYALVIGAFVYKEITWKKLYELSVSSAKTTAAILILIATSSAFSWLLTVVQFPALLVDFLTNNFTNIITFLLFLNIMLIIIGMFLDATLSLIVITPLVLPAAISLGIDPIHLGIIICFNLAIGQFTPPFGLNIFVGNSVTGLDMKTTWKGLIPFISVALIALLLITYIPEISMFLPGLLD